MIGLPRRVVVIGASLALSICPSGTAAAEPSSPTGPVTTINGSVPPGIVLPLENRSTMLDTIQEDGNRVLVIQGIRKAGTRGPIHVHDSGGITCVLKGTATDFVEGHPPMPAPAGTCYYMPPNTPMSVANLGTEDVHLLDTFTLARGEPTIRILEPGWEDSDAFG